MQTKLILNGHRVKNGVFFYNLHTWIKSTFRLEIESYVCKKKRFNCLKE